MMFYSMWSHSGTASSWYASSTCSASAGGDMCETVGPSDAVRGDILACAGDAAGNLFAGDTALPPWCVMSTCLIAASYAQCAIDPASFPMKIMGLLLSSSF
jgi:hypothetical protein